MSDKYYSTGRGGAGNMAHGKDAPSPKLVPLGSNTPHINSDKVTTGRGGFGNIIKNDDPSLTRKLQDVDTGDLRPVTSSKSFVGRGGYGNIIDDNLYTKTSREDEVKDVRDNKGEAPDKKEKKGWLNKLGGYFK